MDQIKAEWFLFHIMYVTQLFFLGHMTHFVKVRHICECAFINEPACDVSDLYDQYCSELGDLIDHHAPTMDRVVTERPHTPWWNHDLDEMRRQVRLREREWRRNRTDDRRLCYTLLRDEYCRLLASTKAAFYSREIESASNDNRAMFGIANRLLGRKCGSVLPHDSGGPTAVANRFAHHFVDKLSLIRSQIQSTPAGGDNTQKLVLPHHFCYRFNRLRSVM